MGSRVVRVDMRCGLREAERAGKSGLFASLIEIASRQWTFGEGAALVWFLGGNRQLDFLPMQDAVDLYLHFGYLPRRDVAPLVALEDFASVDEASSAEADLGVRILRRVVERATTGHDKVIVPISGGLDSRAILAIAVEIGLEIDSFTVGTRGTDDFEYGADVASFLGVRHRAYDVRQFRFDLDVLTEFARGLNDWVSPIDVWFNMMPLEYYDPSLPVLTGLYGDFVAGEFSHRNETSEQTLDSFVADSALLATKLRPDLVDTLRSQLPIAEDSVLSQSEVCRLLFMHTCTYRPNIFGGSREYRNPFTDKEWIAFIVRAGVNARQGQALYHQVLRLGWPSAFSRPTKNFRGASLDSSPMQRKISFLKRRIGSGVRRHIPLAKRTLGPGRHHNYADFLSLFSSNESFRWMVKQALLSLGKRDLVLPIEPELALNAAIAGQNIQVAGVSGRNFDTKVHPAKLFTDLEINLRAIH